VLCRWRFFRFFLHAHVLRHIVRLANARVRGPWQTRRYWFITVVMMTNIVVASIIDGFFNSAALLESKVRPSLPLACVKCVCQARRG
jgi:hypothetical protein